MVTARRKAAPLHVVSLVLCFSLTPQRGSWSCLLGSRNNTNPLAPSAAIAAHPFPNRIAYMEENHSGFSVRLPVGCARATMDG
jgi:hypothetical protein